jgi:predicted dehydrogenase
VKIAIFGCGLIGEKRGKQVGSHEVVGVYDPQKSRAEKLAETLGTLAFATEDDLLQKSGAEIVIIATTNNALAPLAMKAVKAKKHVLVEKPGALKASDLVELEKAAKENKVAVKVGFNHRFHPALLKAKELVDQNKLGELIFLRARYGHGGRLGYEKEWRSDPKISGGGELMDQGVHVLDLIYWFMGSLALQSSYVTTSFWDMSVDDNAVLTVSGKKKWATMHVSCSEWKNTFGLEIYGRAGKILISGLGRSYGKETLTYYKMLPEMGPPQTEFFDFPEEDLSWQLDLNNLVENIKFGKPMLGDLPSAIYALNQVGLAYSQNGFKNLPCSV